MALVLADRVREITTTAGTGTITLAGAVLGFQTFSVVGDGNTTYYCISGQGTAEFEVGIGTYTSSGTTLARTTVLSSSNSNALVNFSAGIKDVFVTYPAEKSVNLDASGVLTTSTTGTASNVTGTVAIANGGTGQTSQTAAFDALSPITTKGDLIVGNGTDNVRLAVGTNDYVLTADSAEATGLRWRETASPTLVIENKTAAYTVVAGDLGKVINCTANTFTVSLDAAATLGSGFNVTIWNTTVGSFDVITIDPNAAETIDGRSTLILRRGEGTQIVCDGTNWQVGDKKTMRGYAENILQTAERPTASGLNTVAIGNNSGNQGAVSTGVGSVALNGSYASGADSFAAAISENLTTYGAKNTGTVAMGNYATASAGSAIAIGNSAIASGTGSVAIASYGAAKSATASGSGSVAIGDGAVSAINGKFAYASGSTPGAGIFQYGMLVLNISTTDATPTVLTSRNTAAASAVNQVILPNNSAYFFSGTVVARQQAAGGTDTGAWEIKGAIRREGSAATTTLIKSTIDEFSTPAGWAIALTADTTNGGLAITVTGAAATNIRWVATVQTSEVTY